MTINSSINFHYHEKVIEISKGETWKQSEKSEIDKKIKWLCKELIGYTDAWDKVSDVELTLKNDRLFVRIKAEKTLQLNFHVKFGQLSDIEKENLNELTTQIGLKAEPEDDEETLSLLPPLKTLAPPGTSELAKELFEILGKAEHHYDPRVFNEFDRIPITVIPIHELKEIPITAANAKAMAALWKKIIGGFFTQGELIHLKGKSPVTSALLLQMDFAYRYLSALAFLPKELGTVTDKQEVSLSEFCKALEQTQNSEKLKAFLKAQESLSHYSLIEKGPSVITFFEKTVRPKIEETLNIDFNKIRFSEIVSIIINRSDVFQYPSIFESFFTQIEKEIKKRDRKLTDQDLRNELKKILLMKVLKVYHLFPSQIEELTKMIDESEARWKAEDSFKAFVSKYEKEKRAPIKEKMMKMFISVKAKKMSLDELFSASMTDTQGFSEDEQLLLQEIWKDKLHSYFYESSKKLIGQINSSEDKIRQNFAKYLDAWDLLSKSALCDTTQEAIRKDVESKIPQPILGILKKLEKERSTSTNLDFQDIRNREINERLFSNQTLSEAAKGFLGRGDDFEPLHKADLMLISKISQKWIYEEPLSLQDKRMLRSTLKRARTDPKMQEKVKVYLKDRHADDYIFESVPPMLHGLVRRFLPDQELQGLLPATLTGGAGKTDVVFISEYLQFVKYLKKIDELEKLNQKVEKLLKQYAIDPDKIAEDDKITLKEIGLLGRFKYTEETEVLKNLRLSGLTDEGPDGDKDLARLDKVFKATEVNLKAIDELILRPISESTPDGSILAYNGKKKESWTGRPLALEDWATALIADGLIHGAKIFHNDKNELMVSEIYGQFKQGKIDQHIYFISDIWTTDASVLVDPTFVPIFEEVFGHNWQEAINAKHQGIEKIMHAHLGTEEPDISNSFQRRIKAALADHPLLASLFGYSVEGHIVKKKEDWETLHKSFFYGLQGKGALPMIGDEAPDIESVQICSEFATRTTAASLIELNRQIGEYIHKAYKNVLRPTHMLTKIESAGLKLSDEANEYLTSEKTKDTALDAELAKILEEAGYTTEAIKLGLALRNNEVIPLPYEPGERFEAVHPGRMVKLLEKQHYIRKVPPPKEVSALFKLEAA